MRMRMSYRGKLIIVCMALFAVFGFLLSWVQLQREKDHAKELYRFQFAILSDLTAGFMQHYPVDSVEKFVSQAEALDLIIPEVKICILNPTGEYRIGDSAHGVMSDYFEEPEVQNALISGIGSGIRVPFGSDQPHFYYARQYEDFMLWMDMPFTYSKTLFTSSNLFPLFLLLLFFASLCVFLLHSDILRKNLARISDFLDSDGSAHLDYNHFKLPDNETGLLLRKIIRNYQQLQQSRDEINVLQEKLIRHFHYVQEGICIFSPQREKIYANALFVQYISNILAEPTFDMGRIFSAPEFKEMVEFLNANMPVQPTDARLPSYSAILEKNGRTYKVRLLVFSDNGFEVSLDDVTRLEQNKALKQEMTNNIAHELKTPVSSIRGYLETVLENGMDDEQRKFFLERAYNQTLRLTDLIQDVSFLNKIEEASDLFKKEPVAVRDIVAEVADDLHIDMENQAVVFENALNPDVVVNGNRTLLYALFRNLVENSLHYAGKGVVIHIEMYDQDATLYHFDYYDTGCGVDDVHLARIFDRFYRVSEGRTRKDGGSGLGLAIVKNAVQFHGGMITARKYKDHGLEFIFSLSK